MTHESTHDPTPPLSPAHPSTHPPTHSTPTSLTFSCPNSFSSLHSLPRKAGALMNLLVKVAGVVSYSMEGPSQLSSLRLSLAAWTRKWVGGWGWGGGG